MPQPPGIDALRPYQLWRIHLHFSAKYFLDPTSLHVKPFSELASSPNQSISFGLKSLRVLGFKFRVEFLIFVTVH